MEWLRMRKPVFLTFEPRATLFRHPERSEGSWRMSLERKGFFASRFFASLRMT
jgi:hypothetical protein